MFRLFLGALVNHLLFTFGGVALMIFALIEKLRKKDTEAWVFWGVGLVCVFMACYGAWVDEHSNATVVISEKSDLWSRVNECDSNLQQREEEVRGWSNRFTDQLGRINGLQNPLNSQQSTFNMCVTTLAQANAPTPQHQSMGVTSVPLYSTKHLTLIVMTTNKPVPNPVRMTLWCDGVVKDITVQPASGEGYSGGLQKMKSPNPFQTPNRWFLQISGASWNPENPLLFWVFHDDDNIGECHSG